MAPLLSGTDPTEHIMISGELPAKIEFGKFLSKFASDMTKDGKGETLMELMPIAALASELSLIGIPPLGPSALVSPPARSPRWSSWPLSSA